MAIEDNNDRPYGPINPPSAQNSPVQQDQSPVAGKARLNNRQLGGIFVACCLGALAVIAFNHWVGRAPGKPAKQAAVTGGTVGRPFQNNAGQATTTKSAALPLPAKHGSPFANPFLKSTRESPAMQALNAPIMAYSGAGGASQPAPAQAKVSASPGKPLVRPASALSNALTASTFGTASAHLIAHPNFTIAAGTIIPCTLQTAIDSGLPGFVKCVLPQPVRSMTGSVTLLDKGTQVMGEIQQGLIQGQDRLFILWTRAVTPQNIAVQLSSPAAGALGKAGISGAVNNHFFERFGAAIMLSIIGGSLQAASNAAQNGTGNSYFEYLNSNTSQIANTALQSTINIPPTLTRNQGANVSIFVARDLNFSKVYKLALVNP
ncbi:type IV secretion system protein VirB10 [Acidiphilium iwatense]|uniref:Type IV secretion system protein VirB10 n=1 Tax=Acidiphilium iwatense TaxID=768198 RepID=A0ABS9DZT1_9PROT|nr:type IV secretion system protein VirB10 [Acidiphilium iwatense]MCF3948256.1 type IV secretion system protein VirB10 [Acidiphilium iwatense]